MSTDFIPAREAELVPYSLNFKTKITASPTSYSLTAAQATTYGGLHDSFVTAYNACQADSTRTPSMIVTKDVAKDALVANLRLLARIVQASPTVSDAQRSELNLPIRDNEPTPQPVPTEAPGLDIVSVVKRTVRIKLHDATGERRGKPAAVSGAAVFSYVGETAPTTASAWAWQGNTTRVVFEVAFADSVPSGAKVWFMAMWYNNRAENGPGCEAVGTNLQGGSAVAA